MSQELRAKPYISGINPYIPGRSAVSSKSGGEFIKLSSNENALGASPKAIEAYKSHSSALFRYADGGCAELRQAIAQRHGIRAENITCGAGSDELISLLSYGFAGAGDEVLYSEYGFLMYPISAIAAGAKPIAAHETNLKASVRNIIARITNRTRIIFIANPNNPTGSYLTKGEITELIDAAPKNVLIVIDMAYAEFVQKKDYSDCIKFVEGNSNVVFTRTFSKIYGLASLRLGWCYSSPYIADILNRIRGPFNVSGAAQSAGVAALRDTDFLKKSISHNSKWLKTTKEGLGGINGLTAYPSVGNFLLIRTDDGEERAKEINDGLLENGIILRSLQAYKLPSYLRMTIGTKEENLKTIECLDKLMK